MDTELEYEYDDAEYEDEADEQAVRPPRWKRIVKRVLIALGVIVVLLIVTGFALYNFGGMSGTVHPELTAQYDQMVASGQAPAIQKRFVIPIPGCTCHSTDPVETAKHRVYRMSECGRCHGSGQTAQAGLQ